MFAHIGKREKTRFLECFRGRLTKNSPDPKVFHEARAGIPVTTQRRFDVYPDVSKGL